MYKSAKWKSYWLIETDIRKTLQASAFSFTVLNLAEKAFLHFPFNYAGLYKERSTEVGGGGGEERSPLPFLENWKKFPWFLEKMSRLWPSIG